jgi:hypothetical protein
VATAALALTILASVLASEFADLAEKFLENLGAIPVGEDDLASGLIVLLIFLAMGLIIVVILVFILGDPELALN